VKIDPILHEEILQKYQALNFPPFRGFVNPVYTAETDSEGNITNFLISYN
jgi:dipeptidyl-peptidase-3